MDARKFLGPEFELWEQGDPFIRAIVQADDVIADHESNYLWLGESEEKGRAIAVGVARWRLSFELETLFRWWSLR